MDNLPDGYLIIDHLDKSQFVLAGIPDSMPSHWEAVPLYRRAEPAGLAAKVTAILEELKCHFDEERLDESQDWILAQLEELEAALANTEPSVPAAGWEIRATECVAQYDEGKQEAAEIAIDILRIMLANKEPSVPVSRVEHWLEYWNKDCNEGAMRDALYYLMDEFADAITEAHSHE